MQLPFSWLFLHYNGCRMKIVIYLHHDLLAELDGNLGQYATRSECLRDLIRKYILLMTGPRAQTGAPVAGVAQ